MKQTITLALLLLSFLIPGLARAAQKTPCHKRSEWFAICSTVQKLNAELEAQSMKLNRKQQNALRGLIERHYILLREAKRAYIAQIGAAIKDKQTHVVGNLDSGNIHGMKVKVLLTDLNSGNPGKWYCYDRSNGVISEATPGLFC